RLGWGGFTADWVAPFGTIFLNALKLIAVPLVLASLITGVASLADLRTLGRIGGKTIGLYLATTAIAVLIGLVLATTLRPGAAVPAEVRAELEAAYAEDASAREMGARATVESRGPLSLLVDIVPDNVAAAAADNGRMLQVVFVAILFGIGLIRVPSEAGRPVREFFASLSDVVIRLVEIIMLAAPVGVFALIAGTITSIAGDDPSRVWRLLGALGAYIGVVVGGLALHGAVVYPVILRLLSPMPIRRFARGIAPAQLFAFSSSSSGATLPITMDRVRDELGVSEEVTSFVIPLGATINMDGTALYQAVAATFIAQALGMELSFAQQATIVLTAVLASIGTAAVPGVGIVMLVIILEAIGVPAAGIALILGVDRPLDMLRTAVNVTGDATVATVVAHSEGQLDLGERGAGSGERAPPLQTA
ncbi:MAG TPA: dicarboxylate/amino acid:cation symporter, partial [Gemmatimonadales bacterium]|nr:dicarboxylate/amino acid:cation symporter [Gemmatimonadales bacterium]